MNGFYQLLYLNLTKIKAIHKLELGDYDSTIKSGFLDMLYRFLDIDSLFLDIPLHSL